jgi:predicted nucleic acid-binding protein
MGSFFLRLPCILLAKQEGHIASASIELSKLIESGFRVSADVRAGRI